MDVAKPLLLDKLRSVTTLTECLSILQTRKHELGISNFCYGIVFSAETLPPQIKIAAKSTSSSHRLFCVTSLDHALVIELTALHKSSAKTAYTSPAFFMHNQKHYLAQRMPAGSQLLSHHFLILELTQATATLRQTNVPSASSPASSFDKCLLVCKIASIIALQQSIYATLAKHPLSNLPPLRDYEITILRLLANGVTIDTIATKHLHKSRDSVNKYVAIIKYKLGASSQPHLVAVAAILGVLDH